MSILHSPTGTPRVNSVAFVARAMRWTHEQRQKVVAALTRLHLF
jgi:hypothetical protein